MDSVSFKTKTFVFIIATAFSSFAAAQSLIAITASPTSASPGQTVTVTVDVSDKCPSSGCVISLSSSNAAVAAIPASMTISFDRKRATKTFVAGQVTAATAITLSAAYNGVTKTTGSTFSVGPAVVVAPPPAGAIIATQTARYSDSTAVNVQRGWERATSYLHGAVETDPTGIKAKHIACMTANNGNGQLTAVGGVINKSKVSVGFTTSDYTVEQQFTCAAGYTGWLSKITITSPLNNVSIPIGGTATFEVCLIKPAPAGGVVAQALGFLGHISVPTSITFAVGETCKSFTGTAVSGLFNVESIMVTLNGFRVTAYQSINY